MTPIERLQAAINLLEQALSEEYLWRFDTWHSPGPWTAGVHDGDWDGVRSASTISDSSGELVGQVIQSRDANLIVTLHRTIDAQLSLLRHAEKFLATVGHHTSNIAGPFIDDALNLADAILATPALAEGGDRG